MKLKITNLSKTYPNGIKALKNINLEIGSGMFGLLGPNGAGKSTLMRTIATLQRADTGALLFDNTDIQEEPDKIRQSLGYLPQEFGVYADTSAEQMLAHIALLKGVSRKEERMEAVKYLLDQTNLFHARKMKLGNFSGGMKQRFGIAQALLGDPNLIIVDEPTAGLDPEERNRFHNLLSEIGEEKIVILSTHIVDDVRVLCEMMAIIHEGKLLFTGKPEKAVNSLRGKIWERRIEKEKIEEFNKRYTVILTRLISGMIQIHVLSETKPENGFQPVEPDIEDVYFSTIKDGNSTAEQGRG